MKKDNIESLSGQTLFVDIDVHKKSFHVTLSQLLVYSWTKASLRSGILESGLFIRVKSVM